MEALALPETSDSVRALHVIECPDPACDYEAEVRGRFIRADEALTAHLVGEHGVRRLAELVISLSTAKTIATGAALRATGAPARRVGWMRGDSLPPIGTVARAILEHMKTMPLREWRNRELISFAPAHLKSKPDTRIGAELTNLKKARLIVKVGHGLWRVR